jgi:hypothetical protein
MKIKISMLPDRITARGHARARGDAADDGRGD